jgi:hypothetical protein
MRDGSRCRHRDRDDCWRRVLDTAPMLPTLEAKVLSPEAAPQASGVRRRVAWFGNETSHPKSLAQRPGPSAGSLCVSYVNWESPQLGGFTAFVGPSLEREFASRFGNRCADVRW